MIDWFLLRSGFGTCSEATELISGFGGKQTERLYGTLPASTQLRVTVEMSKSY